MTIKKTVRFSEARQIRKSDPLGVEKGGKLKMASDSEGDIPKLPSPLVGEG